ncbi:MAG: N-methyl-L-tryptophan oxidase [Planctomycetaceae bacterium]
MSQQFDVIVIGLGAFGSSAVGELAARGVRVLGIEQFTPAHALGSSHGETRIIRKAYFEHPDYVPLLHESYRLWSELETWSGESLYQETGLVLSGPGEGETVRGAIHAATLHNLRCDVLTADRAGQRFPTFQFPEHHTVLFEEQAGYLRVEQCVSTQLARAEALGADLRFGELVRSWSIDGNSQVRVQTDKDHYSAERLIVTAGAWSDRLLHESLANIPPCRSSSEVTASAFPTLRVVRKVQCWNRVEPIHRAALQAMPVYYFETAAGAFYGFPSLDGKSVKVAQHNRTEHDTIVSDPNLLDRELHHRDTVSIGNFVTQHLRGVGQEAIRHAVCMYTMTPDEHFLIDRHPCYGQVTFAAGFSGHGFKFAPVIGTALADLSLTGRSSLPVEFLSLSRFVD